MTSYEYLLTVDTRRVIDKKMDQVEKANRILSQSLLYQRMNDRKYAKDKRYSPYSETLLTISALECTFMQDMERKGLNNTLRSSQELGMLNFLSDLCVGERKFSLLWILPELYEYLEDMPVKAKQLNYVTVDSGCIKIPKHAFPVPTENGSGFITDIIFFIYDPFEISRNAHRYPSEYLALVRGLPKGNLSIAPVPSTVPQKESKLLTWYVRTFRPSEGSRIDIQGYSATCDIEKLNEMPSGMEPLGLKIHKLVINTLLMHQLEYKCTYLWENKGVQVRKPYKLKKASLGIHPEVPLLKPVWLGHTFKASNKHKYSDSTEEWTLTGRKRPRTHYRSGYINNWSRKDRKPVFIQPVIVNKHKDLV